MLLHLRTRLNPNWHFGLLISTSPSFRRPITTVAHIEARLWRARKAYELALSGGKSVAELDEALRLKLASMRYHGNMRLPCPCPCITTLKIELAISRHQWFLIPEKPEARSTWFLSRHVLNDSALLGRTGIIMPFDALPKLGPNLWFTPYWNTARNELRFRLQDGRDLDYAIPFARIGNPRIRSLGRLAVAEGLIKSFDETRSARAGYDGNHIRAFNQDVQKGFQGQIEEWQGLYAKGRNAPSQIKTLVFSKGKNSGQIFKSCRGIRSTTNRPVSLGGVVIGRVRLPPTPRSLGAEIYCLDFDAKSQVLQYRKLSGEILAAPTLTLMHLARHHRPILELAKNEELIDFIPDSQLFGFELHLTRQRGFYIEVRNNLNPTRRDRYIHVDLGNGKRATILIRLSVPPGTNVLRLIPYIDGDQMLRVWNLGTEADMEIKVGIYARNAGEVRRMSPELFAYAQSLGYWKTA